MLRFQIAHEINWIKQENRMVPTWCPIDSINRQIAKLQYVRNNDDYINEEAPS